MRPGLLLNENFPAPALKRLRAAGWDVLSVSEAATSATDSDVMELARSEGRWLVTFDSDYGELVFRQQYAPPPVVLLLRPRSYRPEEPAAWIEILYADSLSAARGVLSHLRRTGNPAAAISQPCPRHGD